MALADMSLSGLRSVSSEDSVRYETIETRDGKFALLTLKPTNSHHLFTKKLIEKYSTRLQQAVNDKVKGLITTHDGEWFSGGFDYKSAPEEELVVEFRKLIAQFLDLQFPTAAYVSGFTYGAGFTLALLHDYLVLSNDNVSLRQDELANGHELPPYAAALVRDKFQLLASLELLVSTKYVTPPQFAPIAEYVNPYVGWSKDEVVEKLLRPLVDLDGSNYSGVRKILLFRVYQLVKLEPARG
ncbi:enoyl-CoA delta isomerase 2, peroxisomal-like [Ananas comosus]|uniref:Enoyl-CoA delta isomerase 2, peroxisomal-like n=1 Tax=Ananas comosus TaxID=4615 RepID=A0A6P5EFR8_ANACO|nr:enoyl-CoA delta isomerase 2, peroxisomal-like [Ananas comosus]